MTTSQINTIDFYSYFFLAKSPLSTTDILYKISNFDLDIGTGFSELILNKYGISFYKILNCILLSLALLITPSLKHLKIIWFLHPAFFIISFYSPSLESTISFLFFNIGLRLISLTLFWVAIIAFIFSAITSPYAFIIPALYIIILKDVKLKLIIFPIFLFAVCYILSIEAINLWSIKTQMLPELAKSFMSFFQMISFIFLPFMSALHLTEFANITITHVIAISTIIILLIKMNNNYSLLITHSAIAITLFSLIQKTYYLNEVDSLPTNYLSSNAIITILFLTYTGLYDYQLDGPISRYKRPIILYLVLCLFITQKNIGKLNSYDPTDNNDISFEKLYRMSPPQIKKIDCKILRNIYTNSDLLKRMLLLEKNISISCIYDLLIAETEMVASTKSPLLLQINACVALYDVSCVNKITPRLLQAYPHYKEAIMAQLQESVTTIHQNEINNIFTLGQSRIKIQQND